MVPPRGMEHPPCPLLRAPTETTEPLLLGARPPRRPLAHFTLCWQEGQEEGKEGVTSPPLAQNPPGELLSPALCQGLRPKGQKSSERNPTGRWWGGLSLSSTPGHTLPGLPSWGALTLCPQRPTPCLTRTAALFGAVSSCRALRAVWVAAAFVQVQALLTLGAEVVAEAGLAVLDLAF